MKKKTILLSAFAIGLCATPAMLGLFRAGAQTTSVPAKPSATVTPTKTPPSVKTPTPTPTPTPEATPVEDEGPIKIDTELVNLNVRVVDRNNRSIGNVPKSDFHVYEDNVEQQIDSFTKGEVPTNYAMVIDNSGSMRPLLDKVIEAGKIIINTNRKDDETSIIRFVDSPKIEIMQDFTADKNEVIETLDSELYIEGGQTAIIDAVYLAAQHVDDYGRSKGPNDQKRRALILVSDGEDRSSFYSEQQLFELLRESDVQIYAIGFVNELSKEGGFISKSPQEKAKAFLERMAKETGGKVYFPNSLGELNSIAQDIATELRTQYILSYYPTNADKAGKYRQIRVTVNDGPNKEKRIAITRTGIQADSQPGTQPSLQNPGKVKVQ